jgi:hypothetical protein
VNTSNKKQHTYKLNFQHHRELDSIFWSIIHLYKCSHQFSGWLEMVITAAVFNLHPMPEQHFNIAFMDTFRTVCQLVKHKKWSNRHSTLPTMSVSGFLHQQHNTNLSKRVSNTDPKTANGFTSKICFLMLECTSVIVA